VFTHASQISGRRSNSEVKIGSSRFAFSPFSAFVLKRHYKMFGKLSLYLPQAMKIFAFAFDDRWRVI
jgi:hypothetical protein